MLKILKDETTKTYTVQSTGGADLTEHAAKNHGLRVLAEAPNAEDWFFWECERVSYDTVRVSFVEDL